MRYRGDILCAFARLSGAALSLQHQGGSRQQWFCRPAAHRPGRDDMAGGVEFLLGPSAKNIIGKVLTVDAGGLL
jgi:hypothetical protein